MAPEGKTVSIDTYEVVLRNVEDASQMEILAQYEGSAGSFGWIVPVPGEIDEVLELEPDAFDEIRAFSAPVQVGQPTEEETGCKCRREAEDSGDDAPVLGDILSGETFAGSYEVEIFTPDESVTLISWITENGWDPAEFYPMLQAYASMDYGMVAVTLNPDSSATPSEGRLLVPLQISYSSDELTVPVQLGSYVDTEDIRFSIYLEGDHRASVESDWLLSELDTLLADGSELAIDVFEDAVWELGGASAGMGITFAHEMEDDVWLNRFDVWVKPEALSADPDFSFNGGDKSTNTEVVYETSTVSWILLPLLGWTLRRRAH